MAKKKEVKVFEVVNRFRDKKTKEVFEIGMIYEGTKARLAELEKLGYIAEKVGE